MLFVASISVFSFVSVRVSPLVLLFFFFDFPRLGRVTPVGLPQYLGGQLTYCFQACEVTPS